MCENCIEKHNLDGFEDSHKLHDANSMISLANQTIANWYNDQVLQPKIEMKQRQHLFTGLQELN